MKKLKALNLLEKKRKIEFFNIMGDLNLLHSEVGKLSETITKIETLIEEEEQKENKSDISARYLRNSRNIKHKLYEKLNLSKNRSKFIEEQIEQQNKNLAEVKMKLNKLENNIKKQQKIEEENKLRYLEVIENRQNFKK
ncbi:MAG: hypothetical protein CBC47_08345 [Alphaproteobacteria bacterium TMED87]|nr:hypothetical protein [Rhodospirillaceae bacterium]OUV07923.1 MAG: hypothetical protein CBC47_08345 [Alphaproteobacteria bacterium TMED87]